jgi:hypothetical protein
MKRLYRACGIIIPLLLAASSAFSETPATITSPVPTEFGTYQPVLVTVTPSITPYEIEEDLSNVVNSSDFELTTEAKRLLALNGFAAEASR